MNWRIRAWLGLTEWRWRRRERWSPQTLFSTFSSLEHLKEITVGYLKVKVALFVLNPMRCFNCNEFANMSQHCRVGAKCLGCGKHKHEGQCEGPKLCSNCNCSHASLAKDCPVWKEREIQVEKHISFPEARQLVEAKMPTVGWKVVCHCCLHQERQNLWSVRCQWLGSFQTAQSGWFHYLCVLLVGWIHYLCVLLVGWISVGRHSGFLCEVEAGTKCSESEKGSRDSADPLKMASKGSASPT